MGGLSPDWRQRLAAAMQHHQSGQLAQAIALYQQLATEQPDHADALHLLGMALDQAGHPAQGRPAIELAIRLSPDTPAYHVSLGNACRAQGDGAAAAAAYTEALRLMPAMADAQNGLGLLAQQRQDWPAARQHFQAALAAAPGDADAQLNLAVTAWSAGETEAALTAFETLLAAHPGHMPHVVHLARRALAGRSVAPATRLIDLLAAAGLPAAELHVLRGNLAAVNGDMLQAERDYRAALDLMPDHRDALRLLSHLLLERQDHAAALPLLEHAHALQPGDFAVFSGLGAALMRTGAYERAIVVLQQVVAHDPALTGAWSDLVIACVKLFRYPEAIAALRQLIALDPGNAANYANLASYEAQIGNLQQAEDALDIALSRDPESATTLGTLANIRDLRGDAAGAEAIYRRLILRDPADAATQTNLALLLLRQGRYAEGWEHYAWRSKARDWSSADGSRGLPRWDGRMPPPGPLLAWREQGIGDEILYAAVLPELAARGLPVVQATDPRLVPLFARSFPDIRVVADDGRLDAAALGLACQRPLADLAALCRPDMASFAAHPRAYLKAAPEQRAQLRSRYQAAGKKLLVGVAWNSRNPRTGRNKSLSLLDMLPLLQEPDATYVSLQYGAAASDIAALQAQTGLQVLQDAGIDPLADIDAQAAQIAALDLVVTVSTATAHLAAALGVPTLILLRQDWGQLWYWGESGTRTPWYPAVQLCRVPRGASAADLVAQGQVMLQAMLDPLRSRGRP